MLQGATECLPAALHYASSGWPVLPLHTPDSTRRCSCRKSNCGSVGKHPRTRNGLKDATTDVEIIKQWWSKWPDANIGVATGAASGIVVLDVDPRNGGNESLCELVEVYGPLPRTIMARTGGNGAHHFFIYPRDGSIIRSLSGKLGRGLDIKGDGGYIVVAPSCHLAGCRYEWVDLNASLQPLPNWLSNRIVVPVNQTLITDSKLNSNTDTTFATWESLNAELKRRIKQHPTAHRNGDGWFHCRGVCHDGKGDTAIMFNPATGAVKCMNGCSYKDMLQAFGLPEQPFSAYSASSAKEDDEASSTVLPVLESQALYGLAGDIVHTILPHTEADPAAILIQLLVAFGNIIGRTAYFSVDSTRHYLNLFVVLIGATSKGRKGTSWGWVNRLAERIDETWAKNCIKGGMSSGEGLIWAVRDSIEKQDPIKEKGRIVGYQPNITDAGVEDKRLLALESEFASVLRVMTREANTLSAIIRQAWDTGNLRVMTKNSPAQATGALVSIIGHITSDELRRNLDETETANGFANRFLWVFVRRSKLLPEGGSLDDNALNPLVERLHKSVMMARGIEEMHRDDEARVLWYRIYEELSSGHAGLLGAVTSRAEAQVMRLACLYALLDRSSLVRHIHLEAALALWRYCEASARYIFGDAIGDRVADEILRALREAGKEGMTQTSLNDLFSGHQKKGSLAHALNLLQEQGRVIYEKEETGGRPSRRWFAITCKEKKAEYAE